MSKNFFQQALEATPKDIEIYVSKSVDVVERVMGILKEQGKTQKDLAKALGKSESEISKWLCGTHNLTLKTIAKIEAALGEDVLVVLPKPQQHCVKLNINSDMQLPLRTFPMSKTAPSLLKEEKDEFAIAS